MFPSPLRMVRQTDTLSLSPTVVTPGPETTCGGGGDGEGCKGGLSVTGGGKSNTCVLTDTSSEELYLTARAACSIASAGVLVRTCTQAYDVPRSAQMLILTSATDTPKLKSAALRRKASFASAVRTFPPSVGARTRRFSV